MTSRSDLWSLGVIAYEMATFRYPFEDDSVNKLYDSIMSKDYKSLPGSYSSNLCSLIGSMLRKNARNRPSIEDLLYYEETIVKAGVNLLGTDVYKQLITAKKRIINEVDWFKVIKNNKLLGTYMPNFASLYKASGAPQGMIHSTAQIVPPKKHKAEDIVEYDEPVYVYRAKDEGNETGDLRKRLEANRLRVNHNQINQAKISRITKENTEDKKAEVARQRIEAFSRESPVKYLKDYDLDNFYKAANPKDNLPKVNANHKLPRIPNIELSED